MTNSCDQLNWIEPKKAPMCCVMPPASVDTIWLFLRLSNNVVFP